MLLLVRLVVALEAITVHDFMKTVAGTFLISGPKDGRSLPLRWLAWKVMAVGIKVCQANQKQEEDAA